MFAGGIPEAGQNRVTLLPGVTARLCLPAPDTVEECVERFGIVVLITGGSEK